jgi:cobaltochelatase CobN
MAATPCLVTERKWWHGQARRQLAVHLALGGARPDGAPRHEIRDELGSDGIQELAAGRYADLVQLAEQAARLPQALVDDEALVQVRIVDQALPAHGGARLLEVDAHDEEQIAGELVGHGVQPGGVLDGRVGIVDRARPDDDQQAVVAPVQDVRGLLAPARHAGGALLGERELLHQDGRRQQRADVLDTEVVGPMQHRQASAPERSSISVISAGAKSRMGGPQKPVPRLT